MVNQLFYLVCANTPCDINKVHVNIRPENIASEV